MNWPLMSSGTHRRRHRKIQGKSHRKQPERNRGAVVAAAGVIGATAGMMLTASPASASPVASPSTGGVAPPGASAVAPGIVSDASIAAAGRNAGLAGCAGIPLGTWVAVALAESGGNPDAHNSSGEDSRGLWQINMRAHAGWAGGADLFDPAVNAQAAKRVCDMQGIGAWSTYTNGSYRLYLGRGAAAAAAADAGGDNGASAYPAVPSGPVNTSAQTDAPGVAMARPDAPAPRAQAVRYTHRLRPGVRQIQRQLAGYGYPVAVDGNFGPRTTGTVKAYQRRHGLVADGVVGPRTRAALFHDVA
nr:peptidoglycan-binding protein [Frankia sp. CiP3]